MMGEMPVQGSGYDCGADSSDYDDNGPLFNKLNI